MAWYVLSHPPFCKGQSCGARLPPCEHSRPLSLSLAAVNEFWVTVQKTEAAERCKLQGKYVLKASWNKLVLREAPSSLPLYTWPYRLLRRYGRDKVSLSGRKGVGLWGFVLFPPLLPAPPETWEAG